MQPGSSTPTQTLAVTIYVRNRSVGGLGRASHTQLARGGAGSAGHDRGLPRAIETTSHARGVSCCRVDRRSLDWTQPPGAHQSP
jgi:hypothetical protein